MSGRRCAFCHATPAPFGFRPPGLLSDLPPDLQGKSIWTCAATECRAKAEERVEAVRKARDLK